MFLETKHSSDFLSKTVFENNKKPDFVQFAFPNFGNKKKLLKMIPNVINWLLCFRVTFFFVKYN